MGEPLSSAPIFPFVQLDLTARYGVAAGRYPVRPAGEPRGEPIAVLVVATVDAPVGPARRRRRSRPKPVEATPGVPTVEISRLTVIRADARFAGETEAATWLKELKGSEEELDAEVVAGLAVINRAMHAQRAAAHDPSVPDVVAERALVVRVGYGSGDALAEGKWAEALEVPPTSEKRGRRVDALRPQERIARVLGGHETVETCEALVLRARADLDWGRPREAALELRNAVAALLAATEVRTTSSEDELKDLAALEEAQAALADAARTALRADPDPALIEETLRIAERVLRRRRILGSE